MIIVFCLLVVIGLGNCQDETASRYQIETSINRTIEEVERMIKDDPRLPRLSRAEIVDILFNITSKSVDSVEDKENIERAREEYQRALMVVLPYSPNSSSDNLSELYTRPPMVQMVSDIERPDDVEMIYKDGKLEEIVYPEKSSGLGAEVDSPLNNLVVSENTDDDAEEPSGPYGNHRNTYSEVVDPIDFKKSSAAGKRGPERFSFDLNNLQVTPKIPLVPVSPAVYSSPYTEAEEDEVVGDSVSTDSKVEIVYSTTVNTKRPPTTKIVAETNEERGTTYSPQTTHRHVLTSGQWHYNAPPTTVETPKKFYPEYKPQVDTASSVSATESAPVTSSGAVTRRPEVRVTVEGDESEDERVTKMSAKPTSEMKSKFSSSYSANHGAVGEISPTVSPMREEVKHLLASIGLSEGNPDREPLINTNYQVPGADRPIRDEISGLEATGIQHPSILSQNTFGSANYDYAKGTQSLTPDMQLLLQRFGLQTSKQSDPTSTTTKKPTPIVVNLNSYSSFRPLPKATIENEEMKDFLAKFGLGINDQDKNRGHKSMKTRKNAEVSTPSIIEAVPDNMKKILENIGLITRSEKSVELKSLTSYLPVSSTTPKIHVFKPHETPVHTDMQKEKINKLLDTVRKVQSGTADSRDVQMAAKDLLETAKTLQNGPDPVSLEEILNIYNEGIKNEVKRQEEVTTTDSADDGTSTLATESTTSSSTTTSPTITTTTMSSEATNAADALGDSFGGSALQAADPLLPGPRRTGLYFLVDWNTFLDVGEDGPDKVNLRFQPKVGDRTRFIPVTVP